jgi:hypothetical protein
MEGLGSGTGRFCDLVLRSVAISRPAIQPESVAWLSQVLDIEDGDSQNAITVEDIDGGDA